MGLFKKGADQLGGGNRDPWFKGNGEVLVKLVSAVAKKNRQDKLQTILTCEVVAASKGADVKIGEKYAYRYEEGGKMPEKDAATYVAWILGFAGLRFEQKDISVLIKEVGLDPTDYNLESARGVSDAQFDIDEKVEALRKELEAGEGTGWAGRFTQVKFYTAKEGGFTSTNATAVPGFMHDKGELTEKGRKLLVRKDWDIKAEPKADAKSE